MSLARLSDSAAKLSSIARLQQTGHVADMCMHMFTPAAARLGARRCAIASSRPAAAACASPSWAVSVSSCAACSSRVLA